MKKTVDVTWKKDMKFEVDIDNHKIIVDAAREVGGNDEGPRPKPLMLAALGGCTGMDVVSLLKKMRLEYDYFNVKVEGDLTDEHPRHFYKIMIIYEIKGKEIDRAKVEKAIDMSLSKYCGVSAVYQKALELKHELRIL